MAAWTDFSGGDQGYLRDVQYRDSSNLDARIRLHERFSTAPVPLYEFVAGLVDWRPDLRVLECGVGPGLLWENGQAPRGLDLTLTDLSPGMVETAVARARGKGFERVVGQECDAQDLPFDDASFDLVIANHMLYHVPDPTRAVAGFARVLRPGGQVVAATNGAGHMAELTRVIAEVFASSEAGSIDARFGIDTGEAMLRERFGSVVWHAYDNDLLVTDPAAVVAYARSFPPGESATGDQVAELIRAVEARMPDGVFHIRTRAGVFVCATPRIRERA